MLLVSALPLALSLASCAYGRPVADIEKRVDLGVPTSWRKFGTSLVKAQRNTLALNAMNAMVNFGGHWNVGGLGYWQSGNVWSALALKDLYAGTQDYAGKSLDAVGDTFGNFNNFRQNIYNDDTLWWASAAIYQSRAYNNPTALSWAVGAWGDVSRYQITGTSGNGKSFSWSGSCSGKSTVGGVFWTTDANDDGVNAITTGLFMTLSAWLYESTKDVKYLNAAVSAKNFIEAWLHPGTNIIGDGFNLKNCGTTPNGYVFTYNSGKYIEGLAVLATATGDSSYLTLATTIAAATMKGAPWQGSDGIITEGSGNTHNQNNDVFGFKAVLIRGLAELYRRTNDNNLSILIHSYVDTQANALVDLASDTGSVSSASLYSVNWHGPYDGNYAWSQLAALDVFGTFVIANSP